MFQVEWVNQVSRQDQLRSETDWCGVVAIDKPAGLTSRQVVDKIAKIVRPAKAGHAGTLDPLATGVLVVAVGQATRLISYLQQGRKQYVGQFRLGKRSDTDDIDGAVQEGGDWTAVTDARLVERLEQFQGGIQQVPPQFSAIHVDGQRAYALARRGIEIDLKARPVEVHQIRLTWYRPPDFELQIECGSGTYVRSIGRDVGEQLGCGAVMTALRRQAVGPFSIETSLPYEEIDARRIAESLQSPLCALPGLPRRVATVEEIVALRQGRAIPAGPMPDVGPTSEAVVVDKSHQLIAVARVDVEADRLLPSIVFRGRA